MESLPALAVGVQLFGKTGDALPLRFITGGKWEGIEAN